MEKKRLNGVKVLGWYLILSSSFKLLMMNNDSLRIEFFQSHPNLSSFFAWVLLFFGSTTPSLRGIDDDGSAFFVNLILNFMVLICGFGLLKFKNSFRRIIIAICILSIISAIIGSIKSNPMIYIFVGIIQVVCCLFYSLYLMTPDVKEQFK